MGFINKLFQGNSDFQASTSLPTGVTNNQANVGGGLNSLIQQLTGNGAGSQQQFAQYLQGQLNGTGPSLANAQLKQALNQNVNQGAAQIASTRGINPALAARQIMQNTAAANQGAVQQGNQNRIQEQLNAGNQEGNLLGQENSAVGTLGGIQNTQNAQNLQNTLTGEQLNQQTQAQNAGQNASTAGGLLGGLSGAAALLNEGGEVKGYAGGGPVVAGSGIGDTGVASVDPLAYGSAAPGIKSGFDAITKEMKTPTKPEEMDLTDPLTVAGDQGEAPMVPEASPMMGMPDAGPTELAAHGGRITGKAKVGGDSPANDTVPAMLSPGEEVLPRSVTMSKDAPERAKKFVEHIKKEHKKKEDGANGPSYGHVIAAQRHLHERLSRLEKMATGGQVPYGTGISKGTLDTFSQGFNNASGAKKVAGGKK